jgi:putative oxidoreductase
MKLFRTENDWALLIARVVLGGLFFIHGSQITFGWFGGHGLNTTMNSFAEMGIPAPLFFLVIAAEFAGGAALVIGLLARLDAFGIICVMIGAISKVHINNGLFMNWGNDPLRGEGYEYHLLAIALAVVILIKGAGALSIDRLLARSRAVPPPPQKA